MKAHLYCLAVFAGFSLSSFGQDKNASVIAAAGDVSASSQLVLEWTLGESAVESVSSSSVLLTQGFHQSFLQVQNLASADDAATIKRSIRVYPNPSNAYVNIALEKPAEPSLFISLLDMMGKVLLTEKFRNGSVAAKLNLKPLSQGTYLLRITDAKGNMQGSYKIIKVQ